MARKRQEEPPKGSPAWMNTFSDLMNLLLCFFVMLFASSTIDAYKWEQVVASLQETFSILPAGGASIGDGDMVSAGVSQLEFLDNYYNEETTNSKAEDDTALDQSVEEAYEAAALEQSEEMAEEIEEMLKDYGITDEVEVDFNAAYVMLNMSGTLLFDSGQSDLREEAYPLVDKLGKIISQYTENIIEIEGHTDNVPISSAKYEDNNVLSAYRAMSVAAYLRDITDLNPAHIKASGRGEYVPVADNSTAEGRARNRRVEIKIYNMYSSDLG